MRLIFATNNAHKITEMQSAIGDAFELITLKQAGIDIDIPEPHDTLEANALEKARTIYNITRKNTFSEDTGLEVEALNGEPGVKSARYAGEGKVFSDNIKKLLNRLQGHSNTKARFRAVLALIWDEKEFLFEGICEGEIIPFPRGNEGFGYDPVFVPAGSGKTFAEMDMDEKNRYSHRTRAAAKLVDFLNQHINHQSQTSATT
ncbi:MAG TPA: RdgB/HAM1 family non-canonical purine NTP pyrophosphatase [Chitinophagaceae bacterium]|nr:RdgB/HAM1 family non-canonical purine NTP pyrophosphatase [Chitinophagaceae bacterium]